MARQPAVEGGRVFRRVHKNRQIMTVSSYTAAHLQVAWRHALHAPVADVHHAPLPRRDLEVGERLRTMPRQLGSPKWHSLGHQAALRAEHACKAEGSKKHAACMLALDQRRVCMHRQTEDAPERRCGLLRTRGTACQQRLVSQGIQVRHDDPETKSASTPPPRTSAICHESVSEAAGVPSRRS